MEGEELLLAAASRGVWKPVKLHLQKRNSLRKKETEAPTAELQPVLVALWVWVENMRGGETRRSGRKNAAQGEPTAAHRLEWYAAHRR